MEERGQITHQRLPSSSIVEPSLDSAASRYNPLTNNQEHKVKRNLIIIGIFAVIIIVVVVILMFTVEFDKNDDDSDESYPWDDYYDGDIIQMTEVGQVNEICGDHIAGLFNAANCTEYCAYNYNAIYAYHLPNSRQCYCQTSKQKNASLSGFCFNVSNNTVVTMYEVYFIVVGRPYNIDNHIMDLKAMVQRINCNDYEFYLNEDEEWMQFVRNNTDNISITAVNNWLNKAFSEHASIATFAKFALDLMSLAAPLWFVEMANQASLDEIVHTQISFDILNMYLKNNNKYDSDCVVYKEFASHSIAVDGDWNRISLDTAIGGCFGETMAAFTYIDKQERDYNHSMDGNVMNVYLDKIVMDELEHCTFAWVAVKWMIDQQNDVDVANREWWNSQLSKRNTASKDDREKYVYQRVIPSVMDVIWDQNNELIQGKDYKALFVRINGMMQTHLNTVMSDSTYCPL